MRSSISRYGRGRRGRGLIPLLSFVAALLSSHWGCRRAEDRRSQDGPSSPRSMAADGRVGAGRSGAPASTRRPEQPPPLVLIDEGGDGIETRHDVPVESGSWVRLYGEDHYLQCRLYHRFDGEHRLRTERRGRRFLVNDRLVGLDLRELSRREALALLTAHGQTVDQICIDGDRAADPQIISSLQSLPSQHLAVVLAGGVTDSAAAVTGLHRLGPKIELFDAKGSGFDPPELGRILSWSKLRTLRLGSRLTEAELALLPRLRDLRVLAVGLPAFTPGVRSILASLRELRALEPSGARLRDEDLSSLAGLPHLSSLDLSASLVTGPGIGALAATPLAWLDLGLTQLQPAAFDQLARLRQLRHLRLVNVPLSAAGVTALSRLPRLRTLSLIGGKMTDSTLEGLSALEALEALDLTGNRVGPLTLRALARLKRLTELDLFRTDLTDAAVAPLGGLRSLRTLDLRGNILLTSKGVEPVAGLMELRRLLLPTGQSGPEVLRHLQGLTRLEELDLEDDLFKDADLAPLSRLTRLRRLVLGSKSFCSLGDDAMKPLSGLKELRHLAISGLGLTSEGASTLGNLAQLRHLELDRAPMGDDGMAKIAALTKLRHLSLARTRVGDDGMAHLAALRELRVLSLVGTQLGNRGLEALGALVDLRRLDVRETRVNADGVKQFLAAVGQRVDVTWETGDVKD